MALAIFDLDKTLIADDSDFLWGEFLVEIGVVDADTYQQQNTLFLKQYYIGKLDIIAYLDFCLKPLTKYSIKQLNQWRDNFIIEKINPILLTQAQKVVNKHKANNDTILAITATNQFIATPIIKKYGIQNILTTQAEIINNKYTGKIIGTPCFQNGKIINLKKWLKKNNKNLTNSAFYSDSHNDLPLLELVDNPVVVNADDKLLAIANNRGWKKLNWIE